jgi:hypothetical protein
MAAALADVLGATALLEPEEADWPEFVRRPHEHGDFTRLTWFRGQRVPLYYRARDLSVSGEVAILDSYYDKWCTGWLGRSGLEWLMAPDDPYFEVAASMAAVDARVLPRADVVVVLRISQGLWRRQLAERARGIDLDEAFVQSHPQPVPVRRDRPDPRARGRNSRARPRSPGIATAGGGRACGRCHSCARRRLTSAP